MGFAHRIEDGSGINLKDFNPNEDKGLKKTEGEAQLQVLGAELIELEELMYAACRHSLLIVLQGMDTSGKDGAIRSLLGHLNAQATSVASFKVPTPKELAHDFLWRVHLEAPAKGGATIFNRSHYEDVVVVRVHNYVPEDVWKGRYKRINDFEQLLADSNTVVLKFFLHISKEEQKERLLEREQDSTKAWKLNVGDWKERDLWDAYMEAYEDAIRRCSAPHAPWFIVPANRKWFRNLAIAERVVEALRPLKKDWMQSLESVGKKAKTELEQFRRDHKNLNE